MTAQICAQIFYGFRYSLPLRGIVSQGRLFLKGDCFSRGIVSQGGLFLKGDCFSRRIGD